MKIGDNIVNEFNEFSVNYTEDMVGCVPHYLDLISSFTKDLPKNFSPKYILDLGCGNGNVTSQIMGQFPKSNYVLLDASEEMVRLCKTRFNTFTVSYINSYFKDYSYPRDYFDMITAGFSLHHCSAEEKNILFQKIYGSLKPGGIFGYSDLMVNKVEPGHLKLLDRWKAFVHRNYGDDEKWKWLMEHYNEFDKPDAYEDQINWLKEAGFNNIHPIIKEGYWIHIRAIKA